MKYNLKNRPTKEYNKTYTSDDLAMLVLDFDEWLEGFQKELRQIYRTEENYSKRFKISAESLIVQILGEKVE